MAMTPAPERVSCPRHRAHDDVLPPVAVDIDQSQRARKVRRPETPLGGETSVAIAEEDRDVVRGAVSHDQILPGVAVEIARDDRDR